MPKQPRSKHPDLLKNVKTLSNEHRLTIMGWLVDPRVHFSPQRDGDLVEDGVCVGFITQKTRLTPPTITSHMQILAAAGLATSKQVKNWVFCKPDKETLDLALEALRLSLIGPQEEVLTPS